MRTIGSWLTFGALAAAALFAPACGGREPLDLPRPAARLAVASTAFADGGVIPAEYTCDGADRSPPLRWEGAPAETAAFAIVVDDPDADGFVHWLAWNLPASVTALEAGASPGGGMPTGTVEGKNDFGRLGYGGPCPPRGKEHRYRFLVYALDAPLPAGPGASRGEVERALARHAIAAGELTGIYRRP